MTSLRPSNDADRRLLLQAILRTDFCSFARAVFPIVSSGDIFLPNWHIEAIAHALDRVRRGESRRLIINVPPRSLKSICASVALPAFILGHDPKRENHLRELRRDFGPQALQRLPSRDAVLALSRTVSWNSGECRQGYRIGSGDDGAGLSLCHVHRRNADWSRRQSFDPRRPAEAARRHV